MHHVSHNLFNKAGGYLLGLFLIPQARHESRQQSFLILKHVRDRLCVKEKKRRKTVPDLIYPISISTTITLHLLLETMFGSYV
jgi:hypothetical protein